MRFSASKSPLLGVCLYSFRDDVTAPEAPGGRAATVGTIAWARAAAVLEGKLDPGNGELDDEPSDADEDAMPSATAEEIDSYFRAALRWIEQRSPDKGRRCEVKYGWSPSRDTARELPKTYDENGRENLRDYSSLIDDERAGSVDLEYVDGDGMLVIEDIKTGHTPLAQYLPQIRTLGLFAARCRRVRRVKVVLTKLYVDKPHESISHILDGFALDAIAEDLRLRLAAAKDAEPVPGPHCTEMFCPARLVCPAVQVLVGELVPADALVKGPRISHEFVSHDHDAEMLSFIRVVEKTAKDLKSIIKKRTPADGVRLASGMLLREGFHAESKLSQSAIVAKAKELGSRAGLTDEMVDQELATCMVTYQKSEGLRVTKGAPKRIKAA